MRSAGYKSISRALAARLGIEVRPLVYPTPAAVVEGLKAGACDLAFLVIDPSRAAVVDFSTPYVERDFTYLVPAGSSIRRVAEADRPGLRIAVVRTHASELALRRLLTQAALVHAETPDAAFDWLCRGTVDDGGGASGPEDGPGAAAGQVGSCTGVGAAVRWVVSRANWGACAVNTCVSTSARFCSR